MRIVLVLAAAAVLATPAAARERKATPRLSVTEAMAIDRLPDDFNLVRPGGIGAERALPPAPEIPRGTDTRAIAWNPPALEVPLNRSGAVLSVGAMGRRHKGMPRLAHVGIEWDF